MGRFKTTYAWLFASLVMAGVCGCSPAHHASVQAKPRVASAAHAAPPNTNEDETGEVYKISPSEDVAQNLLSDQDLYVLVGQKKYSRASRPQQIELLRKWCAKNGDNGYRKLSKHDKQDALEALADGVSDMLAEKDFTTGD